MEQEMRNYIKQYGSVQSDYADWVHPWVEYWRVIGVKRSDWDFIIAHLTERYPDYTFSRGETHINNIIYPTIIITKK